MVAISLHSVVPVRAEAREGSEQLTQMLFGESCTIKEKKTRWNRIKLHSDGQEGWVDSKMICPMKSEEFVLYKQAYQSAAMVVFPMVYAVSENNSQTIPLTAGTRLPNYKDGRFELLGAGCRIDPMYVAEKPFAMSQQKLFEVVRFWLNVPYLWGGKNAMGIDCSGFTQVIMSLFGKRLLRNASEQATQGRKISDLSKAQAGDLVFFDHQGLNDGVADPSHISHVGIVIDSERVIHCSGRVKVEKLARRASGDIYILSAEGLYTHHLAAIRRL